MQREGIDPENASAEDFLCDFCRAHWSQSRPMVEGHRGSLVCGPCLTVAFTELWLAGCGEAPGDGEVCVMCLAPNGDPVWRSPMHESAILCKRCAKQSAVMLERDPDSGWKRPAKAGA